MNYKAIIKNQETRFKILHLLRFIPDKWMIKLQYFIKFGRRVDLKNPKRFNDKLQWYKLYYRDPLMTVCADKYAVRDYVKSKGYGHILNDIYGIYNSFEEINFDSLPDKFVMKTTNGGGINYLCEDKSKIDYKSLKKQFNQWLSRNIYASGREWSYKGIKPRIIIERYLESEDKRFEGINDYKFVCFNGEAKYILVDVNRRVNFQRNVYDTKWNKLDVEFNRPNFKEIHENPEKLNEMIDIVNNLAKEFPFVRVDLYLVNNEIYFGELTFYPGTGYLTFNPDQFDYELGSFMKLDKIML